MNESYVKWLGTKRLLTSQLDRIKISSNNKGTNASKTFAGWGSGQKPFTNMICRYAWGGKLGILNNLWKLSGLSRALLLNMSDTRAEKFWLIAITFFIWSTSSALSFWDWSSSRTKAAAKNLCKSTSARCENPVTSAIVSHDGLLEICLARTNSHFGVQSTLSSLKDKYDEMSRCNLILVNTHFRL